MYKAPSNGTSCRESRFAWPPWESCCWRVKGLGTGQSRGHRAKIKWQHLGQGWAQTEAGLFSSGAHLPDRAQVRGRRNAQGVDRDKGSEPGTWAGRVTCPLGFSGVCSHLQGLAAATSRRCSPSSGPPETGCTCELRVTPAALHWGLCRPEDLPPTTVAFLTPETKMLLFF